MLPQIRASWSPAGPDLAGQGMRLLCGTRGLRATTKSWHLVAMVRIQISLTEPEYEAAKREAARLGVSLEELLRRSLRTVIPADDSRPWMRYAGMVETGNALSGQHLDEVIYGRKA